MNKVKKKHLEIQVFPNDKLMAAHAAEDVADCINRLHRDKEVINIIFSAAESQEQFLKNLALIDGIKWDRINAFTIDEFIAPEMDPAYKVSSQPEKILFSRVPVKSVSSINFKASNIEKERSRYEELIRKNLPDIACLGIGITGHIAFNEPGQCSFNDLQDVKIIKVHQDSRKQLMEDPNFKFLEVIPETAITITIPFLMRCPNVFVIVPYTIKAPIIKRFMESDVDESLPASILQNKHGAKLYLDDESFSLCSDQ